MPPINGPQTNKRRDDKSPAWLVTLLSKLGLEGLAGGVGSSGGSTVIGTQAAGGFSGLWGGLLATKAGIVALVLTATTVAGGIYYASAPESASNLAGGVGNGIASIFSGSSRSQNAAGGSQGAVASGPQDSIQSFQNANQGQIPNQNPADNAANTANANNPPAGGNASTPDNNYSGSSGGSARPAFKPTAGLNASGSSSSGGGNMLASLPPGAGNAGAGSNVASAGARSLSGFGQTSGAGSSSSRMFGPSGARGAMGQLGATNGTVRGNLAQAGGPSSQGSGYTYDGGGRAGPIGGGAGNIGGGGSGVGGAGVGNSGLTPNPSATPKVLPPAPPVGPTQNATPWQGAIMAAMGAMAVALIAFFMMHKFKTQAQKPGLFNAHLWMMAKLMAGIATAAAAVAAAMGLLIMGGYGQKLQGMMWTAIGGAFTAIAAHSFFKINDEEKEAQEKADQIAQMDEYDANALLDKANLNGKFMFKEGEGFISQAGATQADKSTLNSALANYAKNFSPTLPPGTVIKP